MAATARYLPRALEPVLRRAARGFPVVLVTGPRQSGKTTLLRHVFGDRCGYAAVDLPDVRAAASLDPRGFLAMNPAPLIVDEVQRAPELLPYIRAAVDERRDVPGQYLLTGSRNLVLMQAVSKTLAGRVAVLRLPPLTFREEAGDPARALPWEPARPARRGGGQLAGRDLWRRLVRGGYPELVAARSRDAAAWHRGYVATYLERDLRSVRQVGDLAAFQTFLVALAARSGRMLNATDLGRDLGLATNTIRAWISVLEATFQVMVVRPYFANVGKRLVKTPKVYFTDTGILCHLSGLAAAGRAAADLLAAGPMAGPVFETAVLAEVVRTAWGRGEEPRVWFWRTSAGAEVDFVVETGGRLVAIEAKSSATPRAPMASGVKQFRRDVGAAAGPGFVVHAGDVRLPLGDGVTAIPFGEL
ncbi:MAG: ATP-binding protein [Deltaproteobacteria bacterium]|nr:ATP-binding protein [Deltaproteobacteria bacterium]